MKYDIPEALQSLKPEAQWILRGSDYELDFSSFTWPTEPE